MRRLFTALALAASLVAGGVHAATDAESPQGLLKGKLPDDAAGLKRVAISNFVVQFVTDIGVEMKRSSNTFYSKVNSLSKEQLQAAADALYAQLVADLKAAGIEVVAADQLAAQPALADLQKTGRQNFAVINDSTIKKMSTLVGAAQLPMVLALVPDQKLPKYYTEVPEGTYSNQLVGWDQQARDWMLGSNVEVMSLTGIYGAQMKLAEALKATMLSVRVTVPFVDMGIERKVGGFGVGLFSGGDYGVVRPNPRLVEAGTVISFVQVGSNPGQVSQTVMALQKPVPIKGLKFEINKGAPRDGGGLVGALFGAAGVNSDKADFLVVVDPTEFQASIVAAGSTVFMELASTLAAAK